MPSFPAATLRRPHQVLPQSSDSLARLQPSGSNRLDELLVVTFVLVGAVLREVGDRPVECVAVAEARGGGNRVPERAFHIAKLAPAEACLRRHVRSARVREAGSA